ncbi:MULTISPECIES: S8 family serine peptidase [Actinokineospora]|uniref:Serine protease n=1 Tax=Actinokineospora fastidiosa TaxID=1816 RepID=A0A918L799_9PSEU|nr:MULTISPECIES: S8 family serine peptidase [Actinokineospora]UVS76863.1 Extracellular serine proteinase precursor [Actinokineospora sp. UTMC 2448]GGS15263.1 serine protease [Actinokineospora fastidiosa]
MQGKSRSFGRVALAALGAASVTAALIATAGTASAEAAFVPASKPWPGGGFIVSLKAGEATASAASVKSTSASLAAEYGGRLDTVFTASMSGFLTWDMTATEARRLAADPTVKKVYQVGTARAYDVQENAVWGIDRIDQVDLPLDRKYHYNGTASNVTVYVTDTGIKTGLADFEGRASVGADFVTEDGQDCNGHGTHVAGTIGSKTYGVAKKAKLVSVKMLGVNCGATAPDSAGVEAIEWVTANAVKPAVVNASWGFDTADIGDDALAGLNRAGIPFVAAAGNNNSGSCSFGPGNEPSTINVGGTNSSDGKYSLSNYGSCVDILAPADGVISLSLGGGSTGMSGTSMASPHVAGVAALYLSTNTSATPQQVNDTLRANAIKDTINSPGAGSPNLLVNTMFLGDGNPPPPCEGGTKGDDVAIPDTNTAVTSDLVFSNCTGNASASTSVKVDINHTYTADLKVELVGPSGRAFLLHAPAGIGSAAGIHQTFTVDASGEAKNGTWRLRVTDIYRHDTGVIDTWTLTF